MKNPIATIAMENGGEMKIELRYDIAPNTVKNFIALSQKGFYDGLIFHRIIPGFMIQGGCPDGRGTGGPGYHIFGEFPNNGHEKTLPHHRGTLSMARQGNPFFPEMAYNTAGSQFFIMVADAPHLDGDYASFGTVLEGMEVADAIVAAERGPQDKPLEDQKIKSISIETFGQAFDAPKIIAE